MRGKTKGVHNQVNRKGHGGTDGRGECWQSMRIMRRFTRSDLLTTATISTKNMQKFVKALVAVGIVRVAAARPNSKAGSVELLQLAQDLGPKAPVVWTNGEVFDPNHNEVHYVPKDSDEQLAGEPARGETAHQREEGGAKARPVARNHKPGSKGPVHA
jgi:hypothetical protein